MLNEEARRVFPEMMTFDYLWEEHSIQRNSRCTGPSAGFVVEIRSSTGALSVCMPKIHVQMKISKGQLNLCIWNSGVTSGLDVISIDSV